MDNPVFDSSQFASTIKKPSRNLKRMNPLDSETMPQVRGLYSSFRPCDKPKILRQGRRSKALWFRNDYIYGSGMDRKTCIWSCDGDSWLDKSSGIMWVGVHGVDSICVVTRSGDLDIKRVRGSLKNHTIESFLHHFRKTVIAEIEDLADPTSKLRPEYCFFPNMPNKLRQRVDQSIKKPFGIVSVGTDEVHEECGPEASNNVYEERERERDANRLLEAIERIQERERVRKGVQKVMLPAPAQRDEKNTIKYLQEKMESDPTFTINETVQALEYDEKKAIKFLREKMESDVAFTMDETVQAAISAFQLLFGKKFKANEIGVTVMDPDYIVPMHEAKYNDVYAKELEINDIENHLAVINEPSSGGGNSTVTSLKEDDMDENDK